MSYDESTHLLGADGKVYERKIVAATLIAVGLAHVEKTASTTALETNLNAVVRQAHDDGCTPVEIKQRIDKARDEAAP